MNTKNRSLICSIISLLMAATFLFAAPAWSKRDGKKVDLQDSSEKSMVERDGKKGEGKTKNKAKKKLVKKAAVGAAAGVATHKVTSGLKGTGKDSAK